MKQIITKGRHNWQRYSIYWFERVAHREEILKIQGEDQKRSIGSEEYLKASMLVSNNFVKGKILS